MGLGWENLWRGGLGFGVGWERHPEAKEVLNTEARPDRALLRDGLRVGAASLLGDVQSNVPIL